MTMRMQAHNTERRSGNEDVAEPVSDASPASSNVRSVANAGDTIRYVKLLVSHSNKGDVDDHACPSIRSEEDFDPYENCPIEQCEGCREWDPSAACSFCTYANGVT